MTHHIVRKGGIPALACTKSDPALQCLCSLVLKCSKDFKHATISLQSSFPIYGSDGQQTFTFIYDADNLVPGTTSLKPTNNRLSETLLRKIAQGGNPDIRTLSLTMGKACPIWCSDPSDIVHKQDYDARVHQFLNLASALEIQILFDYCWIQKQNRAWFQELIDHPEKLTGFPVDERRTDRYEYRPADWRVSSLVVDAVSGPPPPYLLESSTKRPRQTSPTTRTPSPKRVLCSPAPAGSPTEKATTASTPSPKAQFSPVAHVSGYQDAVTNAVEAVLPEVLANLLAVPPSSPWSPSSTQTPNKNAFINSSPHPPSHLLSALRALLSARGASYAEAQLQQIYDSAVSHAAELHSTADVDFTEYLNDLKYEVTTLKDEGIVELNGVVDDKLAELMERVDANMEEVFERMERKWDDLELERVGMSMKGGACEGEREICKREKKMCKREKEMHKREKEMRKREREMCKREREMCKREKEMRRRERGMCKREKEMRKRERKRVEDEVQQGRGQEANARGTFHDRHAGVFNVEFAGDRKSSAAEKG